MEQKHKVLIKKSMKVMLIGIFLLITIVSAVAFNVVEDFDTLPNDVYWTKVNNSNCDVYLDSGEIVFNSTSGGTCYYRLDKSINQSEDIIVSWKSKSYAFTGTGGGLGIGSTYTPDGQGTPTGCYVTIRRQTSSPSDLWRGIYDGSNLAGTINLDTAWHDFEIKIQDDRLLTFMDSNQKLNASFNQCENMTNISVLFGIESANGNDRIAFDDVTINADSGDVSTCEEPCFLNETFDYDDNICNNGWVAGDCSDLNDPNQYEQYVCDDSDEVIGYPFGRLTSLSGKITIQYDLKINSDYEVIFGVQDSTGSLAFAYEIDNGSITDLRDYNNIGNYTLGQFYTYRHIIDLNSHTYDFYVNNTLEYENIAFSTKVEDINLLFFQPDYTKGSPYCDYVLDNVQVIKTIATTPSEEGNSSYMIGDSLNLNPTGASFDIDKACGENELKQICFLRYLFVETLTGFTDFIFSSFLLFLFFVLIILIIIVIKRNG